ncbi:MAG: S9 family peptidase [Gemmatimonadaceae bacterium]
MRRVLKLSILSLVLAAPVAGAQSPTELTVDRIFNSAEFRAQPSPTLHWLGNEANYVDVREGSFHMVDIGSGRSTLLVDAAAFVGEDGKRLDIEDVIWSGDQTRALIFHSSERVWRANSRGRFHVFDVASRKLIPVTRVDTLIMFGKLSPDGQHAAFVRNNNIYVTDLATGQERALTRDGSPEIINGTTDWVYEEEFGLRDAFRWSPDGRRIAFWRFDQTAVKPFSLIDETQLYPSFTTFKYPKAGERNADIRIGVIDVATGSTRWISTGGEPDSYVPRMEWLGNDSVVFQRLPRKQNRVDLVAASVTRDGSRLILTDSDSAYVDVQEPVWLNDDRQFLWISDRTGWRQVFLYDRSGRLIRQVTSDGSDVTNIVGLDETRGELYVQQAAPTPTQRHIFRYALRAGRGQQITSARGWHSMNLAPNSRYAVMTHSDINTPAVARLVEVPSLRTVRTLVTNDTLRTRVARLGLSRVTFLRIPSADGATMLDAYRIVPPQFDSTRKHPVLMYVYGGPASPTVGDAWGSSRFLWHQMLAQKGYVVVSVDNRGAAMRGRNFRKMTQYRVGTLESDDQIAAARWIGRQSWGDASRIGIWGWSGGGTMTLLSTTRGGNVFKTGLSVAPVTDWSLYDTIYTERYMWTPEGNPEGYRATAALNHVDGLTARLLLVHGTGDDNVHSQNTLQFAQKLQFARKPFYMMLYPNKTHSISGAGATLHLYDTFTRFILENL